MQNLPFKKVLALSPHTDDIEFGCAGTLTRLKEEGAEIHTAVFSLCEESVPEGFPDDVLYHEMHDAAAVLEIPDEQWHLFHYPVRRFQEHRQEILEDLTSLKNEIQPDLVFTPSTKDVHQDHSVISKESIRAFRYRTMLGYELPWNNISFSSQALISLTENQLRKKSEALACYKSQGFRHYSQPAFFQAQATIRGVQGKEQLAEAFEVIRLTL